MMELDKQCEKIFFSPSSNRTEGPWRNSQAFCHGTGEAPDSVLSSLACASACESASWGEQVCKRENTHVHLHLKELPRAVCA